MSSGYRRALESKEKLLKIIEGKIVKNTKKIEDGCPFLGDFMATAGGDLELVKQHVLLFVCALIPKAMASTLAFFLHTSPSWLRERRVNRCGHSRLLLKTGTLQALSNKKGKTKTRIKIFAKSMAPSSGNNFSGSFLLSTKFVDPKGQI